MQTVLPNLQLQGTLKSWLITNKNAYTNFSVHAQHCETLEHKLFAKDSLSLLGHTDASQASLP